MYDLHTHSDCSDGKISPQALVELARTNGVKVLALTDHDTVLGVVPAQAAATTDIKVVAGIEFSALWAGRGVHVVGLQVDTDSPILKAAVAQQLETRVQRAKTIAQRLEKAGIKNAWEGAMRCAQGAAVGRPHFAQYMIDAGYVGTFAQAFNRYLGAGKIGDVKQGWPSLETVVEWINESRGIAVLAHPDKYGLTRTKLYQLTQAFVDAGGSAVEVVSGYQQQAVTDKLAKLATDFSLLASSGSDFHSPDYAWQALGKQSPLPDSCTPVWTQFR